MSTPIQPVPDAVLASEFPSLADRPAGTYNAKAKAWADTSVDMAENLHDIAENVHSNAVAAEERAQAADQRATDAETAKTEAETARDKAQEWAEGVEPEPGSKSAKGWAETAGDAEDSAWAAAAAAGASAGLPEPLVPGKVLKVAPGDGENPPRLVWGDAINNLQQVEIITSQTLIPPFYPFSCIIDAIGGGEGGANGNNASSTNIGQRGGDGGGAGQISGPIFITLTEGQALDIVIGSGGASNKGVGGTTTVSIPGVGVIATAPGGGANGHRSSAGGTSTTGAGSGSGGPSGTAGAPFGVGGIFDTSGALANPLARPRLPLCLPVTAVPGEGALGGSGVPLPWGAGGGAGGGGGGAGLGPGGKGGKGGNANTNGSPGEPAPPGGGGGGGGGGAGGRENPGSQSGGPGGAGGVGMVRIYF